MFSEMLPQIAKYRAAAYVIRKNQIYQLLLCVFFISCYCDIPNFYGAHTIKNGTASAQNRTLTIFGITGTLPANTTEITDAGFLQQVEANDSYQSVDVESKKAGLDATLALSERMRVLRVPAGAVFGINGSTGCIVPTSNNHGNTPVKVSIVGGELGVSLVQADSEDIASISNVEIGSGLNNLTCE